MLLGSGVERLDLVVQDRAGEVELDGPLPLAAPARGAAAVGDHHREALVGEPLGDQEPRRGRPGPAVRAARRRGRAAPAAARLRPGVAREEQGARSPGARPRSSRGRVSAGWATEATGSAGRPRPWDGVVVLQVGPGDDHHHRPAARAAWWPGRSVSRCGAAPGTTRHRWTSVRLVGPGDQDGGGRPCASTAATWSPGGVRGSLDVSGGGRPRGRRRSGPAAVQPGRRPCARSTQAVVLGGQHGRRPGAGVGGQDLVAAGRGSGRAGSGGSGSHRRRPGRGRRRGPRRPPGAAVQPEHGRLTSALAVPAAG